MRNLQQLVSQGSRSNDIDAANAGMRQETGLRFYTDVLAAISGGVVGTLARGGPIRVTTDMLGRGGTLLGERSAGRYTPLFKTWLERDGGTIDILPGGKVRYTTRITDPYSRFAGQSVSVDFTEGVPDFSRYSVARVDVPNPCRRSGALPSEADQRAATRILRDDVRAGRVSREEFTQDQLDDIERGQGRIRGFPGTMTAWS